MSKPFSRKSRKSGFTLMEALVSFGILATTGVLLAGFLYRGPVTQKARNESYGQELAKIHLLAGEISGDTVFTHGDANGNRWEIPVVRTGDGDETCYRAVTVRNGTDTTRALYYCRYGTGHDK